MSGFTVERLGVGDWPPKSVRPFGPSLADLMWVKKKTYRALAVQTGLSAGYLCHLVRGNRPVPSNDVIETLAEALGVHADHFLEVRIRSIVGMLESDPVLVEELYRELERRETSQ